MVDRDNRPNRRTVLRTTGIVLGGAVLATGPATADRKSADRDDEEDCGEVLSDTDRERVVAFDRDDATDVFIADKRERTVSLEEYAPDVSQEDVRTESIQPMHGHNDIVTDFQGFDSYLESCGGNVYSSHHETGIAIEFGSSIGDFSNDSFSGAVCGALGAVGGIPGMVTGVIGCAFISTFVLPSIDTDGEVVTIGFWDCHGGLINQASLCLGASDDFVTSTSGMEQLERYNALHLEGFAPV